LSSEDTNINIAVDFSVFFDTSFYYRNLLYPVAGLMPVKVFKILEDGYEYLSSLPGLSSLEKEVMLDPERRATLRRLSSKARTDIG